MNLPSFDQSGNISMHEIILARPKQFEQFGINAVEKLVDLKIVFKNLDSASYLKTRNDILYDFLKKHETKEMKERKPFTALSPLFCFYFNIYGFFTSGISYHHMTDEDIQKFDQEILECEIESAKNYYAFRGRGLEEFLKTFKDKPIVIPKNCPFKSNGKDAVTKKTYKVTVRQVSNGYYLAGLVKDPSFSWKGERGWNEAYFKDVYNV